MIELLNIFHKLKMLSFANTFYFVNVKKFSKLLFRTTKKNYASNSNQMWPGKTKVSIL